MLFSPSLSLSIISVMNSSVFAVRSLLAVAICSNFSSARIGKQLPPVPTSAVPGRQPGCQRAALPPPLPRPPPPHTFIHTQAQYGTFGTKLCCRWPEVPISLSWDPAGPAEACISCSRHAPQSGTAAFFLHLFAGTGGLCFSITCLKDTAWLEQYIATAQICFPLGDSDLKL